MSEDTPLQYIQGVYTPEQYLQYVQSPKFFQVSMSYSPNMPEPAMKRQIANLIEYVKSLVVPSNVKQQNDLNNLANLIGGNNTEENFENVIQSQVQVTQPVLTGKMNAKVTITQPVIPVQPKTETKYFTESGIKFKLENGELYKKEWVDEPIEPYMDKVTDPKTGEEKEVEIIPDFRLVNKETGKPVKLSKYVLQQAVWKKLES